MSAQLRAVRAAAASVADRIEVFDWEGVSARLDAQGSAVLERVLAPDECRALAGLYSDEDRFRSRVVMARHGFGRGEYKYFSYPLPGMVADLRSAFYPRLAPIANRWNAAMRIDVRYPEAHADFLVRCHDAGQVRPTPLLLQYARMITTAFIRIFTAIMCFRCRSRFCCRNPEQTSREASSC